MDIQTSLRGMQHYSGKVLWIVFTDLTYMGGTGPCERMTIIFGSVIKS